MTVGTLELHAGVYSIWSESGLDWVCKQHWSGAHRGRFMALGETELAPGCPFPYVVFELNESEEVSRMSGTGEIGFKRAVKQTLFRLSIYAKQLSSGGLSAKMIAADVLDHVMQAFGGHPIVRPKRMNLTHSAFLNCRYENDYGTTLDDDVYLHVVNYRILTDSPIGV